MPPWLKIKKNEACVPYIIAVSSTDPNNMSYMPPDKRASGPQETKLCCLPLLTTVKSFNGELV